MPEFRSLDIVVADRGWVLEAIARKLVEHAPPGLDVRVVDKAEEGLGAVQLFLPYSAYVDTEAYTVAFFTHQESIEPASSRFIEVAKSCDLPLCMSEKYARLLRDEGVTNAKSVGFAVDTDRFSPILRVGVVGRAYSHTRRKGEDLLAELNLPPGVEIVFSGEGWHRPSIRVTDSDMPKFYSSLDYLLVPSRIEGGPAPLLEALACGVPVIAPSDIGFVSEFPHISFRNGDLASLEETLLRLYEEKCALRSSVESVDWASFGERLFTEIEAGVHAHVPDYEPAKQGALVFVASHGSELQARGGPTTRIRLIESFGSSKELRVQTLHNPSAQSLPANLGLVHLFNSWPLKTAELELRSIQRRGIFSLYSPIALNLECLPVYTDVVPPILYENRSVEERLAQLKWRCPSAEEYTAQQGLRPVEGVDGHFSALRKTVELADHIIVLSEYERTFLERIGCDIEDRSTLVVNGVDAQNFLGATSDRFVNEYGVSGFVLATGRVERRKNQAILAKAVSAIPGLKLVLIGAIADEQYYQVVRSQIDGKRLVHIDRIEDRALLASAYAACSAFANCAFAEGASLASIEAFHAGASLVLSDQSSEREYFGAQALYVHPLDVRGMSEAIETAINSPIAKGPGGYLNREEDSGLRHVEQTTKLYRTYTAGPRIYSRKQSIGLDVTHWAHSVHNSVHPTGVTRLEEGAFSSAKLNGHDFSAYFVWNSPNNCFVELSREQVSAGMHVEYANSRQLPKSEVVHDTAYVMPPRYSEPQIQAQHSSGIMEAYAQYLVERRAFSPRQLIRIMRERSSLANSMVYAVKVCVAETFRVMGLGAESKKEEGQQAITATSPKKPRNSQPPHQLNSQVDVMMVIGQPWISNDRYIESLESFILREDLDLSFYVHDLTFVTHPRSHRYEAKVSYRRRLRRMLAMASKTYVNGDSILLDLRRYCAGLKLKVSMEILPYSAFSSGIDAFMSSAGVPEPRHVGKPNPIILMVSTLNARKGHEFALDIWDYLGECRRIGEFKLYIVGKAMGAGELVDRINKTSDVRYIGDADDQLLEVLYKSCAFTVFPSESEGWGLPIQESADFGKVCIASDRCPAAIESTSKLVETLSPDDFFGWVDRISHHMDKYRGVG
ncbi:MAG: glycosyltransferase [Pseudomonadota bacterium]